MFEEKFFARKKPDMEKLLRYGFTKAEDGYLFTAPLSGCPFLLKVRVSPGGNVAARVIDPGFQEEYTLYRDPAAAGAFVQSVRAAVEAVLADLADSCFAPDVFHGRQTLAAFSYVRRTYGDTPAFLWKKFPECAALRRAENGKWYGVLASFSGRKIGFSSDIPVEILVLHASPGVLPGLIDGKTFFPGWHMNKKTWYTVLLDGSLPDEQLFRLVDESYGCAII